MNNKSEVDKGKISKNWSSEKIKMATIPRLGGLNRNVKGPNVGQHSYIL